MEAVGADGAGLGQTQKSESKCPRLSPHFVPCLKDAQDPPSYLLPFFSPHYSLTCPEGDLEYGSPIVLDKAEVSPVSYNALSPVWRILLFCGSRNPKPAPWFSPIFLRVHCSLPEDKALQSGLQPNWQVSCSSLRRELEEVWDQCQPSSAGPGREK